MPFGPGPAGFVYFAAAKYFGYTVCCRFIQAHLETNNPSEVFTPAWQAGFIRTGIGLVIGVPLGLGFGNLTPDFAWKVPLFFALLLPVRVFEWWLLLRLIYLRYRYKDSQKAKLIAAGIVVSFVLDGIGVAAAFVLPGGMWVC